MDDVSSFPSISPPKCVNQYQTPEFLSFSFFFPSSPLARPQARKRLEVIDPGPVVVLAFLNRAEDVQRIRSYEKRLGVGRERGETTAEPGGRKMTAWNLAALECFVAMGYRFRGRKEMSQKRKEKRRTGSEMRLERTLAVAAALAIVPRSWERGGRTTEAQTLRTEKRTSL